MTVTKLVSLKGLDYVLRKVGNKINRPFKLKKKKSVLNGYINSGKISMQSLPFGESEFLEINNFLIIIFINFQKLVYFLKKKTI